MNKYNDGLNNETEVQIISTYRRPLSEKTKNIIKDLGTVPSSISKLNTLQQNLETTLGSAEMYNNTNISDLDGYCYTFQQSSENACAAQPRISPLEVSSRPVAEGEELERNISGLLGGNGSTTQKNEPKRLNPNDYYTNISVAVNNIRIGDRYKRMTMYVSLQEANDKKYTIFLVGNLTTAHDEVKRSITSKSNHQYILDIYESMVNTYSDCLIGRFRYNPGKKKSNIFYKKNIKSALATIYRSNDDKLYCHLHIVGNDYIMELTDRYMSARQKETYDFMGYYAADLGDIDD